MSIDKKQWGSWVIALGVEISNSKDDEDLVFRAKTIKLGMERLIEDVEQEIYSAIKIPSELI
jgi:hypothetical protein